jgi:L-ascorbate metabolism protein UlaG (beta-lactamase superfamily)
VDGLKLCKAKHALGHHWGTFQLTNEPIEEPKHNLTKALGEKDVIEDRFLAMKPGQVWRV